MQMPSEPLVLNAAQIQDLNHKLSVLRHDINGHLALIMAATELIRHKPSTVDRMLGTLLEQPQKITEAMTKFSTEFEQFFGIKRESSSAEP